MYDMLKPHIVLPIHGDTLNLNCHAEMAIEMGIPYAFNLNDGQMLILDDKPEILTQIPSGILAVDGCAR